MDKSAVKKIISENIQRMLWVYQIQDWKVTVEFGHIKTNDPDGTKGTCVLKPGYKRAAIALDPESFGAEDEVLQTFRHELMHILHSDFQTYREMVCELVSRETFDAIDVAYHAAAEDTVRKLENMMDHGLGLDGHKAARLSRRHQERRNGKAKKRS